MVLGVLMAACGGKKAQQQEGQVSDDSLAVESHVPTMEELMLPDTAYASVAALDFKVVNDDSVEHPMQDFNDRYDRSDRVMTFRKNLMRDADFGGTVTGTPSQIEIAWV